MLTKESSALREALCISPLGPGKLEVIANVHVSIGHLVVGEQMCPLLPIWDPIRVSGPHS